MNFFLQIFFVLKILLYNFFLVSQLFSQNPEDVNLIANIYNSLTTETKQSISSLQAMQETGFSSNHAGILFPWDSAQLCKERMTSDVAIKRLMYQLELNRDYYGFLFLNNPTVDSHILDAGCGCGISAVLMSKRFDCYVDGYTLGNQEVECAQALAKQNNCSSKLKIAQGNMLKLPVQDNSYDVVWMSESSEYIHSLSDLFGEMRRVAKNQARFILFTGCAKNKSVKKRIDDLYHMCLHSIKDYLVAAKKNNFKIVHQQKLKEWVTPYFNFIIDGYLGETDNQLILSSVSGELDYYLLCFDIQK